MELQVLYMSATSELIFFQNNLVEQSNLKSNILLTGSSLRWDSDFASASLSL